MRTLDLPAAAEFLGLHPATLQARAKAGDVPGAKIGKEWRFIDLDLAEYLRANYPANQPKNRRGHVALQTRRDVVDRPPPRRRKY